MLIAVERHLDGRPRQAFAVGFLAALDRPEIWLFWGPYGLWLFWRDPGARKLVIGLFALIPVLWFVPEYWGSGHFLRGVSRAQHAALELRRVRPLPVLLRARQARVADGPAAGQDRRRDRRARGRRRCCGACRARPGAGGWTPPREHALAALLGAALLGAGWFVIIAIMTQAGFSGNNRYLVLGAALIDIAGGAAFGWAARAVWPLRLGRVRLRWLALAVSAGGRGVLGAGLS